MRKLITITFTGIDNRTDPDKLREIQKTWPNVEFGILLSKNWNENGGRYIDPGILNKFQGLNLSLHLCGEIARKASCGDWDPALNLIGDNLQLFGRVQINEPVADFKWTRKLPGNLKELIQQRKFVGDIDYSPVDRNFSVLLDPSGGRGIRALPVATGYKGKIGYAGGFGPDNIREVIEASNKIEEDGEYWIDMETKVRDEKDNFSPELIIKTLEQVWPN